MSCEGLTQLFGLGCKCLHTLNQLNNVQVSILDRWNSLSYHNGLWLTETHVKIYISRFFWFGVFGGLFLWFCLFVIWLVGWLVFWDRVSLRSPGCLGTLSVDQASLGLRDLPAFAFSVLGWKACIIIFYISFFNATCHLSWSRKMLSSKPVLGYIVSSRTASARNKPCF